MLVTVLVPSFNESGNVEPLVRGLEAALDGVDADVLYVDDSTDDTPDEVRRVAARAGLPLAVHHRDRGVGGLSGAVVEGLRRARGDVVVVMDGDLQHPPATVPELVGLIEGGADIAVASRYVPEGDAGGPVERGPAAGLHVRHVAVARRAAAGARGLLRPDDGLLRRARRPPQPRAPRPVGLQDPARDPGDP